MHEAELFINVIFYYFPDISKNCDVFMNDTSGNLAPVNISSDIFLTFINIQENEIDCIYTIQVPTGLVVQIPPFKVYMEDSFGCQQMFLEVNAS